MNQYEQPPGRFLEVIVGLITSFISLVFCGLFLMLAFNAGLKYITFIGGSVLLLTIYWFGLISVRLISNIPNKNGGLFSIGGLKFLCIFLGVSMAAVSPLALYMGHWSALIGCTCMSFGCFKGWQMAVVRGKA